MNSPRPLLGFLVPTLIIAAGCQQAPPSVQLTQPSPGQHGRDIRCNAALALAWRGSPKIKDPVAWDLLLEMLDEPTQLQNYRAKLPDGREVSNEAAARETTRGALRAVAELHRKKPAMDLSGLRPALEKLTGSTNKLVATDAKQVLQALEKQ